MLFKIGENIIMNEITFFDKLPAFVPRSFWEEQNNFLSGMNKIFKEGFTFNSTYPYDIYNKIKDGKTIATVIEIAAAGFNKEDCNVFIKGNVLTLKLEKKKEDKENKEEGIERNYIDKRIAYRSFNASWSLSNTSDKKNIKVSFKNGILNIEIPIIQAEEPIETKIEIE